ncbi:acyl carrier protein [Hymenobacter sp. BT635]|uniref:Acyl carrier protein n=1 Tax=Hymenobacter nitidus TaxID=2880929 RepID=A0ABS8A864_9BACT|nr:acyl carrier protein [Hymenobacter nitidus]MCB2376585.1 acyl carrier protein [Hymenobacter nitidus]
MEKKEIIRRLWELLIDAGYERFSNCSPEELKDELLVDLGLDSMGLLHLMVGIETEFGIEWRTSDVNSLTLSTLNTIASFLVMEAHNEVVQSYGAGQEAFVGESYFPLHHQPAASREQLLPVRSR